MFCLLSLRRFGLPSAGSPCFKPYPIAAVIRRFDGEDSHSRHKVYNLHGNLVPPLPESYDGSSFEGKIPMDKISRQYSLSSGAGGQHVQKTESKVTLSFDVAKANWLPQWIRERLQTMYRNRIHKSGALSVSCETSRSQITNESRAVAMLEEMIKAASEDPDNPYKSSLKYMKERKQEFKKKSARSKRHQKLREERLAKYAEAVEIAKNWPKT